MKTKISDIKPYTLDGAIDILNRIYQGKTNEFRDLLDGNRVHFTLGMFLRNTWKLWEPKTILVQWFKETYGIEHADDISGIILDSWHRDLNNKPRRVKELVKKYKAHWVKEGKY